MSPGALASIVAALTATGCAAPQQPGSARTGYIAANAFDGGVGGVVLGAIAAELWWPDSDLPLSVGFLGGAAVAGAGSYASDREPTRVEVGLIYAIPAVVLAAFVIYARKL